ncbi:putative peroxin 20 [Rosellinia necatrix]|uniref:Putative peroxin 20 n=1 Tax=Rosellinia necatrix TaxID=77044 RepID=A0A1W2TFF5_ROSNE|nr:putative peroxin 20 [Rosellinia necatrix]
MADASCGPSNAFKGLARHVEQDRSHQQDRVVPGSQHPTQGFRSAPPDSGLTSQFNAFQQQNAALRQPPASSIGRPFFSHADALSYMAPATVFPPSQSIQQPIQQPALLNQTASTSWVTDFQHMALSNGRANMLYPQPAQDQALEQANIASAMRSNIASPQNQAFPAFAPFSSMNFLSFPAAGPTYDNQFSYNTQEEEGNLEQEFEDAMNEWMLKNGPQSEMGDQSEPDVTFSEPFHEAPEEDPMGNQDQETELARAAQQLVDSVADNDSEKFKNSEFLALMRRIASQQLTVQGNTLVENPEPPSVDAGLNSHVTMSTPISQPLTPQPGPSYQNRHN